MTARPVRVLAGDPGVAERIGVVGIDITGRMVDGEPRTAVQLLLDDDAAGFDRALLDRPLVAELYDDRADVVAREPFDHDMFRRRLRAELDAGQSIARGVLVLDGGELPPPWIRLAFLPVELGATSGLTLVVRTTSVEELVLGVERAHAAGAIGEEERRAVLTTLEQIHPDGN